jgi:hypothetical protein
MLQRQILQFDQQKCCKSRLAILTLKNVAKADPAV